MVGFIGRQRELSVLKNLLNKKQAQLIVLKGRRRIGKSSLVQAFAQQGDLKNKKYLVFTGLPPETHTTSQSQRDEFSRQFSQQTNMPDIKADDWSKLFYLLAETVKRGKTIILFDEISWMGSKDPNFLGQLKNAWDLMFKKNPKLILILCGSVSSWIEKNIISSTGFFGRISLRLTLEELPLKDCNLLLQKIGFDRSNMEKLMLLAVTGGVPWYIESINPTYSAAENIKKLCFEKNGLLVDEYQFIFHDLFGRRGEICKRIVECLADGSAEYTSIASALRYHSSGSLSEYLDDLIISGFLKRDFTWSLKQGKDSKLSRFRLSDNYLRFYLKYIAPRLNQISKGQFSELSSLPNWDSMIGLQFENVILNNRQLIFNELGLKPDEIIADNPFFQRKTVKQHGCQIDYLIQTKHQTLFACEIKFSHNPIDVSVVTDMKEKLSRLALPRGFSCLPVLIHINGISQHVVNEQYFFKTIDFSTLL